MVTYRPEIDGLRTVAIVPVVLFHAGISLFQGGFVGVDVFFVISGYLITSIILDEMRRGEFSFAAFYERRIRRLIPPLVPVLLASWVAATLILDIESYEELAKSVLSVLTATANWFFLAHVDYFDGPAESKPLLHIWSLAVEEQFYLFIPPALLITLRILPRLLNPLVLLVMAGSFIYSCTLVLGGEPSRGFYDSLARFWELYAGVVLALGIVKTPGEREGSIARFAGAAMVLAAIFLWSPGLPFPGPGALLPVLGTALIIWAGPAGDDPVIRILKSRPFVAIGKVSYAWYLWHWPVFVFLPMLFPRAEIYAPLPQLAAVLFSLGLSFLSLWYIEDPVRRKRAFVTRPRAFAFFATSLAATVVLAIPGFVPAVSAARVNFLYPENARLLETVSAEYLIYMKKFNVNFTGTKKPQEELKNTGRTCSYDKNNSYDRILDCLLKQSIDKNVLVIGDSVGRDTFHSLRKAYPKVNFVMIHQSGCAPADFTIRGVACFPKLERLVKEYKAKANVNILILAQKYSRPMWPNVERNLSTWTSEFRDVVMIGATPVFKRRPGDFILQRPWGSERPLTISMSDFTMVAWDYIKEARAADELARRYGVVFINTSDDFCPNGQCVYWKNERKELPLFWDTTHLSRHGIDWLANILRKDTKLSNILAGV